jgi:hypothetical protein
VGVRADRIRTVMSSARLHVAKAEKGCGDCWGKIRKVHVVGGGKVDKVTGVCDRAGAAHTA